MNIIVYVSLHVNPSNPLNDSRQMLLDMNKNEYVVLVCVVEVGLTGFPCVCD